MQNLHLNGFSPVWIRSCLCKLLDVVNAIMQNLHWNGFSPVWMRSWSRKLPDVVNAFMQNWHWNGLSPVWMRSWSLKCPDCANAFLQNWHANGFSPVRISSCFFKSNSPNPFVENWHADWRSQKSVRLLAFNDFSSQLTAPLKRLFGCLCCRRDITESTASECWSGLEQRFYLKGEN